MTKVNCCYKCPDRDPSGCHATCEKYQKESLERSKFNDYVRAQKSLQKGASFDAIIWGHRSMNNILKAKRKERNK